MKIAILTGSIRIGRQSHKIAEYLKDKLKERGLSVDLIDQLTNPLPVMEERMGIHPNLPIAVKQVGLRLQLADALLFVTPEYHGSFSGILKNTLDYFWTEFNKKPIGVVAVSAGKMGGINASTQLQHVILSLGAYALPTKLLVPEIQHVFGDSLQPGNNIALAVEKFLGEFLWFADAIYQKKQVTV